MRPNTVKVMRKQFAFCLMILLVLFFLSTERIVCYCSAVESGVNNEFVLFLAFSLTRDDAAVPYISGVNLSKLGSVRDLLILSM